MENNITRHPFSNAIVFHDFEIPSTEKIQGWFELTEQLFQKYGLVPNRIGLSYFEKKSSPKSITFKVGKKRLYEQKFEDIKAIDILAMPPDYGTECFDFLFGSWFHLDKKEQENSFIIVMDAAIIPMDQVIITEIIQRFSTFLKPRYGYVFKRRFLQGPGFYHIGMLGDNDPKYPLTKKERQFIDQWGKHIDYGPYKAGDLRDIYPCNILSQAHMNHIVGGMSFSDWISKKSYRGKVIPIQENLWAWWVEEENIPVLQEELAETGFLICV